VRVRARARARAWVRVHHRVWNSPVLRERGREQTDTEQVSRALPARAAHLVVFLDGHQALKTRGDARLLQHLARRRHGNVLLGVHEAARQLPHVDAGCWPALFLHHQHPAPRPGVHVEHQPRYTHKVIGARRQTTRLALHQPRRQGDLRRPSHASAVSPAPDSGCLHAATPRGESAYMIWRGVVREEPLLDGDGHQSASLCRDTQPHGADSGAPPCRHAFRQVLRKFPRIRA